MYYRLGLQEVTDPVRESNVRNSKNKAGSLFNKKGGQGFNGHLNVSLATASVGSVTYAWCNLCHYQELLHSSLLEVMGNRHTQCTRPVTFMSQFYNTHTHTTNCPTVCFRNTAFCSVRTNSNTVPETWLTLDLGPSHMMHGPSTALHDADHLHGQNNLKPSRNSTSVWVTWWED